MSWRTGLDKVAVRTQKIAPSHSVEVPETAGSKPGHIKVRLVYLTHEPKHMRSAMLRNTYGAKPPYTEDVCVLMPRMKVFPWMDTYIPVFTRLQCSGVISPSAKLTKFTILDEDDDTLAYIVS